MIITILRKLVKLFGLPVLVNKGQDNSIVVEYWFKSNKKLSIEFLPLVPLSNFVFYKKYIGKNSLYNYIEIESFWLYIYYMY